MPSSDPEPSAVTALALKSVTNKKIEVLETPAMGVNVKQLPELPDGLVGKMVCGLLLSSRRQQCRSNPLFVRYLAVGKS